MHILQTSKDAKVWPISHPYGTGSERSEVGSGSPAAHARNRATLIQSWFRRTARWAFWKLDCLIKNLLFQSNFNRRKRGRPGPNVEEPDPYKRYFGTTVPSSIPESASWWQHQAKDLFALTEEGVMNDRTSDISCRSYFVALSLSYLLLGI